MSLRSKFRDRYSTTIYYPALRKIYRRISFSVIRTIRKLIELVFSLLNLEIQFDRYSVLQKPILRPTLILRGLNGPAVISKKHYFSFKIIKRNYLSDLKVRNYLINISNFNGFQVIPVSILEIAIVSEGLYKTYNYSKKKSFTPTHILFKVESDSVIIPRESSFFHFYIQVIPFILRHHQHMALFLELDPLTTNLEILTALDIGVKTFTNELIPTKFNKIACQKGLYPSKSEVLLLRQHLTKLGYSRKPLQNIYITRLGNVNGRHIDNEGELISLLLKFDFKIIDPGKLKFTEQLSLFSKARIVIAPHGAALSHIVNFPKESRILELNNEEDVRWHIRKMAIDLGIDHTLILGKRVSSRSFAVNLKLVEEFLSLENRK